MYAFQRGLRLSLIASLLVGLPLFGLSPVASGQSVAPSAEVSAPSRNIADRSAWLYVGSDIAHDPAWRFGTLTNGLRYAVRKNGVPPGQVSIRVRIDAGSLMEEDSERGYAHLIEHLSFRGSEYVPDGDTIRVWQRLGVTFGSDSNAETNATETVYKLDLPSATEASLDESMKILAGMVAKPRITQAALDGERPAVLAERREGLGPQSRFADASDALFYAGQRRGDRAVIGKLETLEAATPAAVQAFHDRWYRPERVVVSIAGDLDPALFERLVAKYFGAWRGVGPAPVEPDFGKPDPTKPATAAIVEPGLPTTVVMSVVRPWHFKNDTLIMNQERMVDTIAVAVINRRLEARARAGGSYVAAGVANDDLARSANVTQVRIAPIGDDWEAALKDVRAVIADAQANPPSQAEIDRELADQDVAMKTMVETMPADPGNKLADSLVEAVNIRETTTSSVVIRDAFLDARRKKMFTPARVLAATRRVFTGDATRAIVTTPKPDSGAQVRLAAALGADVKGMAGARTAQAAVDFSKLPRLGPPATIVSRDKVAPFGIDRVVLSNGVRMLVYSTTTETDRVYVRVRFGGGYNALPADHDAPVWAADMALVAGGIGKLNQGDLDQMTAGRQIGLDFGVDDDAFQFSALTSRRDLADQLKLIAAKLEAPAWDPAPLARAKSLVLTNYAGMSASPDGVLSRDLDGLLHSGDPRWQTPSPEQINGTTPDSFRALWAPLLAAGPIEVQVFGDVNADEAIKAVTRTIGALKPRGIDLPPAPPVRFPAHDTTPLVRTHDGPDSQAAAVIAWPTGGGVDGIADSRRLDVLAAVFSNRLFDRLRMEAKASYSPNVSSSWPIGLPSGGRIVAVGQVAPANVPLFFKLAREIAADLVANPISDDELKRTVGPMTQSLIRQSTSNQFWMVQLRGATYDPRRLDAFRRVLADVTNVTAAQLQETAQKYLRPDRDWTMEVVPKSVASTIAAAR
ncbi:insulinase family protein [Sphingomonas oligophenolica]|uniref:Insulinase family protein n=1 Tax=Sphingomonas oligophenolica TaxID=301154 RepID=A0ABU9Y9T4_9SPHN